MKIILERGALAALDAGLVAAPVASVEQAVELGQVLGGYPRDALRRLAREEGFRAGEGQRLELTAPGRRGGGIRRLALIGLRAEALPPAVALCRAAAEAARWARAHGGRGWALWLPALPGLEAPTAVRQAALGALAGAYDWSGVHGPKRGPARQLPCRLRTDAPATPSLARALAEARVAGRALELARDLVNAPPNLLTPRAFSSRAAALAGEHGLEVRVWDRRRLLRERCHLVLAVGRGSAEQPCLIRAVHRPRRARPRGRLVLVGKGLTFDAGGLALKSQPGQLDMKADMAGAAVALAATLAAAELDLPWELHALLPVAENMPDGKAFRTGDVLTSRDGRTVEVHHPDAEGRLLLADALSLARELAPDLIVDLATLTGACKAALGPTTAGVFSNHDGWCGRLLSAAEACGEGLWRLPLEPSLRGSLRSDSADLRNAGARFGGAIAAALFLEAFVERTPWIHVDMAGPAFLEREHGLHPKGGTGFGLLSLLELMRAPQAPAA